MNVFGIELLPDNGILHAFFAPFCAQPIASLICKNLIFLFFGFSPNQLNTTIVPSFFVHYPAGSSSMQLNHFFQEYTSGNYLFESCFLFLHLLIDKC